MKKQDLYVAVIPNDNMDLAFSILNGEYEFAIFRGSKVIMKNKTFGYSDNHYNYIFITYNKALNLIKDAICVEDEKVRKGLSKSSDNYDKYRVFETRFILNSDKALRELISMPPLVPGSKAYLITFSENTEWPLTNEEIVKAIMNDSFKLVTVLEVQTGMCKVLSDDNEVIYSETFEGIYSSSRGKAIYVKDLVISLYDAQQLLTNEAKKYFSYYRELNLKSTDLRINYFKDDKDQVEGN